MPVQEAISIQSALNGIYSRQSSMLGLFKPSSRTPEENWKIDYSYGFQRIVQYIHDLTIDHGAYCYCDD